MTKRIVIVSDCQVPFQCDRQVNSLAGFIRATQPDDVMSVGDHFDLPMVSRWTRNRRGEFDGNIQEHIDEGRKILEKLQVHHLKVGNHDIRIERYVENYAPALSRLNSLKMENVFGLDDLGVVLHRDPYEFTPGWLLLHGDEHNLSQKPGQTAAAAVEKLDKSVVCSHTHRQAIIPMSKNALGEANTKYAMEVGCLMDFSQAHFLRNGASNWTAGFGVIDISNNRVVPTIVQMSKTGSFLFEGHAWEDGRIRHKRPTKREAAAGGKRVN